MAEIERTSAERKRTGVATGAFARNELTGERIPIWVADYVLSTYGTGAIMAVPAHDERDFDFANRHGLEIREVVSPDGAEHPKLTAPYVGEGVMVRSGPFSGTRTEDGRRAIAEEATRRGIGGPSVTYRLRDWLISRQRYWGTPIPIIYCDDCGIVPVPEKDLPVILPRDAPFTAEGGNPLAKVESFVRTTCPRCGKPARRETDTMDTFVDSSWYVYRYPDPKYDRLFMNAEKGHLWLPVARYTGGIEHAILHLLYARFVAKALRDLGYLWFGEPFKHLRNQGNIVFGGRKMSKSRGNVQAPDEYVARYGADSLRLFLMFMGPWTEGSDWDAAGIEGTYRFLNRVWGLAVEEANGEGARDADVDRTVHRTIQKVTEDLEAYHFNTAIAAMMELSTTLSHARGESREQGIHALILLLAPFAPHIAEELWERRGGKGSVHQQTWPTFDPALAAEKEVTLVVQVDGKVRDRLRAAAGLPQAKTEEMALASPRAKAALDGRIVDRVVVVPDRLVNIVTRKRS
jgi:leucyl-tRNA synthetase